MQRVKLASLLVLFFCFSTQAVSSCERTLKLGYVANWPPLTYHEDGRAEGLDIEIARLILSDLDICITYVTLPSSARTLKRMEKGDIDLAVMVSYTDERAKYGFFSTPYRSEQMRLFSVKKPRKIKSLRSLLDDSKTIGLSIGSYYGEEIEKLTNIPRYHNLMVSVSSAQQRAEMLVKNRVNFIIEDLITGLYIKSLAGNNSIQPWPYIVHDNQVHFLLRRTAEHKLLIGEINTSIAKLRPQIDKLVSYYSRLN